MIYKYLGSVLLLVAVVFGFIGCQAEPVETEEVEEYVPTVPTPFSRGPSGPPSVKGPTSPPPGTELTDETPQAVTETEDVRITLPESS
jgi:hypothetical protein